MVAASTKISHVFGEEGRLVYQGYEISELAGKATYEEAATPASAWQAAQRH